MKKNITFYKNLNEEINLIINFTIHKIIIKINTLLNFNNYRFYIFKTRI